MGVDGQAAAVGGQVGAREVGDLAGQHADLLQGDGRVGVEAGEPVQGRLLGLVDQVGDVVDQEHRLGVAAGAARRRVGEPVAVGGQQLGRAAGRRVGLADLEQGGVGAVALVVADVGDPQVALAVAADVLPVAGRDGHGDRLEGGPAGHLGDLAVGHLVGVQGVLGPAWAVLAAPVPDRPEHPRVPLGGDDPRPAARGKRLPLDLDPAVPSPTAATAATAGRRRGRGGRRRLAAPAPGQDEGQGQAGEPPPSRRHARRRSTARLREVIESSSPAR